jgi:hypothetical protein
MKTAGVCACVCVCYCTFFLLSDGLNFVFVGASVCWGCLRLTCWVAWADMEQGAHVCMCACVHVCMRACVHVCMCACVHVCMCACVHVCMRACVHACMRACVHMCMRACVTTCECMRQKGLQGQETPGWCLVVCNVVFVM